MGKRRGCIGRNFVRHETSEMTIAQHQFPGKRAFLWVSSMEIVAAHWFRGIGLAAPGGGRVAPEASLKNKMGNLDVSPRFSRGASIACWREFAIRKQDDIVTENFSMPLRAISKKRRIE